MEKFNILNQELTFDDDLIKYMNIYNDKNKWIDEYIKKYSLLNMPVSNENEFFDFLNNFRLFIVEHIKVTADNLLNILVNFQIFDKSAEDIIYHCKSIGDFNNLLQQYKHEFELLLEKIENDKRKLAQDTANQVEGYYTNIISSSAWDIIAIETFNDIEEIRTQKKQQKVYNRMMSMQDRESAKMFKKALPPIQEEIYSQSKIYGINAINEMFDYCISLLISENKLKNDIIENLQIEKSTNILNNINRIQDISIQNEQIIIALMADPFSINVHSRLLDNLQSTQDISEYIRFIKFIHFENNVLGICENKCTNLENEQDKYVKIINAIDENYIANVISKANTIEDIENSNPSEQLSISKKIFYMNYDKVYDTFLYASNTLGKILEQDKSKGHIVVKCSMSLNNILNPATIDIKIIKQNANQTIVEISSLCKTDGMGVLKSPQKWKEKLLEEVNKKLGNDNTNQNSITQPIENTTNKIENEIKQQNSIENNTENKSQEYNSKMNALIAKSKAKKTSKKIYLIFLLLLTLFNIICGLPISAIIVCDICLSLLFYPIIYACTRLYYKAISNK